MASNPDATAFMTLLSGSSGMGPALAQPTISFIQSQITAMLPSQYASAITAQFAGGSEAAAPSAPPAEPSAPAMQMPAPAASDGGSAAIGAGLAQPTIDYIQSQITALVPSQYAESVLAQFNAATTSAGPVSLPMQAPAGAAMQSSMISDQLKEFFAISAMPSM